MKIWFDEKLTDFSIFKSEKFLLLPFFEKQIINLDKDFKNADNWITMITSSIQLVTKEEADIFVYHDKLDTGIVELIPLANKYNKKIIAFYNDDNSSPTSLPNCVDLYRTSLYKTKQKINEFSLPAWSADLGASTNCIIRKKEQKPVIGFCGAYTHPVRETIINHIKNNNNIITNFILRKAYWGGSVHNVQIRSEYVDNTINSDFIICCRGAGNFSYRLFEAMSLGRIPIIINTDTVLPCEPNIDWKSICIWVDDIDNVNNIINNFWNKISNQDYIALQYKIRKIYERYICPAGFTQFLQLKYSNDQNRKV